MGLFADFDIVNDFGYIESTPIYGIYPDYSAGCQVFIQSFIRNSTLLVPVDTGYLRSTLTAGGSDTYCYAETDCEYAQYPEYGTWCQAAQPYFEPALERALAEAAPYWDAAQEEAQMEEEELRMEEEAEQAEEAEEAATMNTGSKTSQGGCGLGGGSILGAILAFIIIAIIAFFVEGLKSVFSDVSEDSSNGSSSFFTSSQLVHIFVPEVIIT